MSFVALADRLKKIAIPLKNSINQKYSALRYESSHRKFEVKIDDVQNVRINIIVPTIDDTAVFGGVTTALKIFNYLYREKSFDARIISLDQYKKICRAVSDDFKEKKSGKTIEILSIEGSTISVRKNDYFIATYWTTALVASRLIEAQIKEFGVDAKLFYLIQDYEPGFYPWSTDYVECERTYHLPFKTVAIINSMQLYEYFKKEGYSFYKEIYFSPSLNENLKKYLLEHINNLPKRKKRIIIYGRPQEHRNAYTLVIDALNEFSRLMAAREAKEWEIWSLGADCKDVNLSNGMKVISKGKVSIEEYAQIMLESYAAISLMISPHPSYPPLEMSTFGIKTITNMFANKDMSSFNANIISLKQYDAVTIAKELYHVVIGYGELPNIEINSKYVSGNALEFNNIVNGLIQEIVQES